MHRLTRSSATEPRAEFIDSALSDSMRNAPTQTGTNAAVSVTMHELERDRSTTHGELDSVDILVASAAEPPRELRQATRR